MPFLSQTWFYGNTSETPLGCFSQRLAECRLHVLAECTKQLRAQSSHRKLPKACHGRAKFAEYGLQVSARPLPYLVLIDAPYPYDGVSTRREKPVEGWVQLQGIDSISIVLLHFISDHIGNLTNESSFAFHEATEHAVKCSLLVADLKFKNPMLSI